MCLSCHPWIISFPDRSGPGPLCIITNSPDHVTGDGDYQGGGKLIEAFYVCSLLENSGVTVWPGGLILNPPVSLATTKWPLQTRTLPVGNRIASFEASGNPLVLMGVYGHLNTWLNVSSDWSVHIQGRFRTLSLITCGRNICHKVMLLLVLYIHACILNRPLSASPFPKCRDPATLLIARVAPGRSTASSGSVPFSGVVTFSTMELQPSDTHVGATVS